MLNQLVSKYKTHPLLQEPISLQTSASAYADEEIVESESEDEPQVSSSMIQQRAPLVPSRPKTPREANRVSQSDLNTSDSVLHLTHVQREEITPPKQVPGSSLLTPRAPSASAVYPKAVSATLVSSSRGSSTSSSPSFPTGGDGRQTAAPSAFEGGPLRATGTLHRSPFSTPRPSDLRDRCQDGDGGPRKDDSPDWGEDDEPVLVDFSVEEIDIDLSVEEEADGEEEPLSALHFVGAYTEAVNVTEEHLFSPAAAAAISSVPCPISRSDPHAEKLVTEFMDCLQTRHAAPSPPPSRDRHAAPPASRLTEVTNTTLLEDLFPRSPQHRFHYAPTYLNRSQDVLENYASKRQEDMQSRDELQRKSNFREVLSSVTSSLAAYHQHHHHSDFWEDSTSRAYYETREDRQHHARERAQRELVLELCLAVQPYKRDLLLTLMMLSEEDGGPSQSNRSTVTLGQCAEAMNVVLEKFKIRATRATRTLCARIVGAPEIPDALNFYRLDYATFASNVLEIANSPEAL